MMKSIRILVLLPFFSAGLCAQLFSPDQFQISAGYSVPYAPEQFYDYWNDGFGVQGAAVYSAAKSIHGMISAEVNRFAFDENRFYRKLGLTANVPAVDGGATTIASLSGLLRYRVPGYEAVLPYVFAGLGFQYSHKDEVTIQYPFAPVTDAASGSIGIILPVGASVEFSYKRKFDVIITMNHTLNIMQKADNNSDYSQLRIGLIIPNSGRGDAE